MLPETSDSCRKATAGAAASPAVAAAEAKASEATPKEYWCNTAQAPLMLGAITRPPHHRVAVPESRLQTRERSCLNTWLAGCPAALTPITTEQ